MPNALSIKSKALDDPAVDEIVYVGRVDQQGSGRCVMRCDAAEKDKLGRDAADH